MPRLKSDYLYLVQKIIFLRYGISHPYQAVD